VFCQGQRCVVQQAVNGPDRERMGRNGTAGVNAWASEEGEGGRGSTEYGVQSTKHGVRSYRARSTEKSSSSPAFGPHPRPGLGKNRFLRRRPYILFLFHAERPPNCPNGAVVLPGQGNALVDVDTHWQFLGPTGQPFSTANGWPVGPARNSRWPLFTRALPWPGRTTGPSARSFLGQRPPEEFVRLSRVGA